MNEIIHIIIGIGAWIAVCALGAAAVCAAIYTAKPEDK